MKTYLELINWVLEDRLKQEGPVMGKAYARVFNTYTMEKALETKRMAAQASVNEEKAELEEAEVREILEACLKLDKFTKDKATVVVSKVFKQIIDRHKLEEV